MEAGARIESALDDGLRAISEGAPTSVVVRAALRLAMLRQDPLGELWLRLELEGIDSEEGHSSKKADVVARLVALSGAEAAQAGWEAAMTEFRVRRTFTDDGEPLVQAHGVARLESNLASMRAIHDDPITPGMTPIDTGLASIDRQKAKAKLAPLMLQQTTILDRIRDAAYAYLLEVESAILTGQAIPDALAQGREFVDRELSTRAPVAFDALAAAQERLTHGDEESLSHTATSCRRAIKALADALYPTGDPVTDEKGTIRKMDDEHYRNRLTEYVRQRRGRSTHADLLASNLVTLGTRLKSLDDLASKGVHGSLSQAEAESCVSWTYMLAADLLRIEEQADQEVVSQVHHTG